MSDNDIHTTITRLVQEEHELRGSPEHSDEQRDRLKRRIDDPHKRWKISEADVAERRSWDDYQRAYEDALTECTTDMAPWYIVPSDHKWYRNFVVSRVVHETLAEMDPRFPSPTVDLAKLVVD